MIVFSSIKPSVPLTEKQVPKGHKVLEISTNSDIELGQKLASFNLMITLEKSGRTMSIENLYQGSKVYENGGPYTDLYDAEPLEAKKDTRKKTSGELKAFQVGEQKFPHDWDFFTWIYIVAMKQNEELFQEANKYNYFGDRFFNARHPEWFSTPARSLAYRCHYERIATMFDDGGPCQLTVHPYEGVKAEYEL